MHKGLMEVGQWAQSDPQSLGGPSLGIHLYVVSLVD